jgi:hypothetical protein
MKRSIVRAVVSAGVAVAFVTGSAANGSTPATPRIPGVPALTQRTPTKGGGGRPVLRWKAVRGAVLYQVVVLDASGSPYWAWQGDATKVPMGGAAGAAPRGTPTATVGKGFSWTVAAFDDRHTPLALSARRPLAP